MSDQEARRLLYEIQRAKDRYGAADRSGDEAGKAAAHADAERARDKLRSLGYADSAAASERDYYALSPVPWESSDARDRSTPTQNQARFSNGVAPVVYSPPSPVGFVMPEPGQYDHLPPEMLPRQSGPSPYATDGLGERAVDSGVSIVMRLLDGLGVGDAFRTVGTGITATAVEFFRSLLPAIPWIVGGWVAVVVLRGGLRLGPIRAGR